MTIKYLRIEQPELLFLDFLIQASQKINPNLYNYNKIRYSNLKFYLKGWEKNNR